MKIELTKEQIQLIYNLIIQVNWNGQQIDNAYKLKKVFEEAIKTYDTTTTINRHTK